MAVTLGGFAFQRLEIPEEMPFSGGKHLMVHKLIGGDRVFDDMGDDPDPIEWSGIFLGGSASGRARELSAMKEQGGQYMLTWGSFSRQVVIRHFKPRFHFDYNIKYTICVEVVPTQAGGDASTSDLLSADFASLGGMGLGGLASALVDGAGAAVSAAAAAAVTGQFLDAPLPALLNASGLVQGYANQMGGLLNAADAALPEVDMSVLSGFAPIDAGNALLALAGSSDALSTAATAADYMGRIAGNVALYGG